jgi:1,2-diacylglycerol 3-alpha-glucosyltransferase
MRVAIFTESYEPIVNGVSVSVATLRDGLRARGHEVFTFAPRFPGHQDDSSTFRFPSIVSQIAQNYPVPYPSSMHLWREFQKIGADIVHAHTPFLLGLVARRWARKSRLPLVSTNHTLYTEYAHYVPLVPKKLTQSVLIKHMRWYYSKCDGVVVPSVMVEQILRGYGVTNNIEVIGSGIAPRAGGTGRGARGEFGVPDDAFLLLYVGRVAREKNLGLLLQAFAVVKQKHPQCRLMIAGSGPCEQDYREMAGDLGVADSVIFTGMLSRAKIDKAYGAADLFVFPSMTETQGLVACEALVAGLPCVAVRAAANPEVMQDGVDSILTTNLVEPFAEAISRVVGDPELRERLSQGALRNAGRFSIESMTDHFEKFYQATIIQKQSKLVASALRGG